MSESRPRGRPTDYSPEIAKLICARLESHGFSLRRICAMYDDMPVADTIYRWRSLYEDFSERYLASRLKQAHILFETSLEDIEDIALYRYEDDRGVTRVDPGIVAAQKALANHKTAMAGRIRPKDYGDRQQTEANVTVKHEADLKALA